MSLMTAIGTARSRPFAGSGPTWRLPSAGAIRTYLFYAFIVAVLFVIGYGGANWLAAQRATHLKLFLDAELAIPLLPAMIWIYLSINLLFVLPVFRLDTEELGLLGRRMIAATVAATLIFLAMPTTVGFARLATANDGHAILQLLYALDHPFNCVPSLHVAYSTLILSSLAKNGRWLLKATLAAWLALIMASTVLTHQHHLIDIASALLLVALICLVLPSTANKRPEFMT
jgi:membrane-associated phospholipid phosphatase